MRWIIVVVLLYLIPLVEIFRNYQNLKRACLYSSIYTVLVTTIVISNIYMSGLGKIEEAMYYQAYVNKQEDQQELDINQDEKFNISRDTTKESSESLIKDNESLKPSQVEENTEEVVVKKDITKEDEPVKVVASDLETIENFKSDIYEIEKIALIPMRKCMPYTKNIAKSITKLSEIKEDIKYAKDKCDEVISLYKDMSIPSLQKDKYTIILGEAKDDLIKTYELRREAMDSAINLIESKNPKYITRITQSLNSSDKNIADFKERLDNLKEEINKN